MKQTAILLSLLLTAALLLPVLVHAEGARATLLIEANTGAILSENNADEHLPIGSLAKLMTAYLAAQALGNGTLSADTLLTAGESVREVQGAVIWLEPGDTVTVDELLMGLLAGNANDAAAVLAEYISGTQEAFVMDMNAAAFDLGMRETRFTTPQGYDDPAAYSTARDMGLLACAVLKCELLRPYVTTWRTVIREDSTPAELVNENRLTRTMDNCRGLKAAHSEAAGECVIAAAERNGMICAAVVLGCGDEDERFSIAKQLLSTGFSGYRLTTPGLAEEFLQPLKIRNGTENAVLLELSDVPALTVPAGSAPESVIVLPEYRNAPVRKGQAVGAVYFYEGKTLLGEAALLASDDVPIMTFGAAWRRVLHYLFS